MTRVIVRLNIPKISQIFKYINILNWILVFLFPFSLLILTTNSSFISSLKLFDPWTYFMSIFGLYGLINILIFVALVHSWQKNLLTQNVKNRFILTLVIIPLFMILSVICNAIVSTKTYELLPISRTGNYTSLVPFYLTLITVWYIHIKTDSILDNEKSGKTKKAPESLINKI